MPIPPPDPGGTSEPGRTPRYLAPDLARGFMLLLIALANVAWWAVGANETTSTADRVWLVLRTGLVDQRAYPLFGILFGFGLATLARRHRRPTTDDAARDSRRLLRRRGWWLLAFGALHSLIFPGDVLGNYGLAALVLAGFIVGFKVRWLAAVSVVTLCTGLAMSSLTSGAQELTATGDEVMQMFPDLGWPTTPLLVWVLGTALLAGASLLIPAIVGGVLMEGLGWLRTPGQFRRWMGPAAMIGLVVGFGGALYEGLQVADVVEPSDNAWSPTLNYVTAPFSALGWLFMLTWLAGHFDSGVRRNWSAAHPVQFLMAIGKRSLSAYLAQTVVFVSLYTAAGHRLDTYGAATQALIAVGVWALVGFGCWVLDVKGVQGPAEWALRRLAGRSAAARSTLTMPVDVDAPRQSVS